jgi:hypothetical protein
MPKSKETGTPPPAAGLDIQAILRQVQANGRTILVAALILLPIALLIVRAVWTSFFKYVEPGYMLITVSKTGDELEPGQILARKGQKGIQEEVLGEGRHFVMPVVNEVELAPCVRVAPGHVGVVTAKTGADAPAGRVLVDRGQKGIWREVLLPGVYRLNPHGYKVEMKPAVRIRPGTVGFVTNLVGDEPKARFAEEGERGMRRQVLEPGVYYLNPYAVRVDEVEVGIDQVSFLDDHMIRFPSADAFEIRLESSVEWELHPDAVAEVMAEFGTPEALEEKVLVPQSKSIGRLAGSRYGAKDFLLGEGREKFQQAFTAELERICEEKHIDIHSAFIRHISIPANLLRPIQEAFIAVEKEKTAKVWEETRKSAAELERAQALIVQRKQEVDAETTALVSRIKAEAERDVGKIEAETRKLIATKQKEIAELDAERTRVLGQAAAAVEKQLGAARASRFALQVAAFGGDAEAYRRHAFAEALPPTFAVHLVQAGPGTFWTDLAGTAAADTYVKLRYLRDGGSADGDDDGSARGEAPATPPGSGLPGGRAAPGKPN